MKFSTLTIGLVALLTPLTAAWSKEDREIFRVRDELAAHEGPDVSFYDFLGVSPKASQDEINKAYKRKSKALHPDKVRQQIMAERTQKNKAKGVKVTKASVSSSQIKAAVKKASERQARLGIVTNVLRGPGRDRYDHFLKHGFPTWKGTEYYYNRYRPGLGTVLLGCLLVGGGGFHYIALYMSWRRRREFVERYIKFARHAAWGDNFAVPGLDVGGTETPPPPPPQAGDDEQQQPPIALNRKQRRFQERETRRDAVKEGKRPSRARGRVSQQPSGSATPIPQAQGPGPTGAKKRVVAENGKILVVDSLGDVYLEQEDADGNTHEFLLDADEIPPPTVRDTALFRFPGWAYALTIGRALGQSPASEADGSGVDEVDLVVDVDEDEVDSEAPQRTPSTDSDDFEFLEKSVEGLPRGKAATGSQAQSGKAKKRNKKR
jgi:curved DNA-binding protein CbpA